MTSLLFIRVGTVRECNFLRASIWITLRFSWSGVFVDVPLTSPAAGRPEVEVNPEPEIGPLESFLFSLKLSHKLSSTGL